MSPLTAERLRGRGQALMEEVSREYYLAHAGLKPTAELRPIYARYADVLGPDALALARELEQQAPEGSEGRRAARLLLEWQVESQTERALAELDERQIAWESAAVVRPDDGRAVPYHEVAIEVANTVERGPRLALDRARAALVGAELAPLRRERFAREREFVESLGIAPSYNATFAELSGIDLPALVGECERFLADTADMWRETVGEVVRDRLGIPPEEATRADAVAILRGREFDGAFPRGALATSVRQQLNEMGVDPDAAGRIRFDTGERPGKHARAFCAPVRIPDEIYLVLRPFGGQVDYRTLLHELGHALHFAYARGDYPFEYRWLGDASVTEAYAMLLDHLLLDPKWLARYTQLGGRASVFLRAVGFDELQFLRRYCAKLVYEFALYSGAVPWDALPDAYVETLTGATTFRYNSADAFIDVDPRFYAARYLRAWQLQALLADALVDRFDDDWWRNPRAGPWITAQLFAEGQRERAEEIADRIAARSLSFAPLVRTTEALLVAT